MHLPQLTILLASALCCNLHAITVLPDAPVLNNKAYVLVEANSGSILAAHNADMQLAPASLTKMMTSYMVEQALLEGKLHENDSVQVPAAAVCANNKGLSCMFMAANAPVRVIDALRGLIIQSGNDAASALAHKLAHNETTFALQMNQQAQHLGMHNSQFKNASGLPQPGHYASARDLAILGSAIVKHSQRYFPLYKETQFSYNGILQANRNSLLGHNSNVDGFKTGHTTEAGYCIAATSLQNNIRLIAVVLGAPSASARAGQTKQLFDWGHQHFMFNRITAKYPQQLNAHVWYGQQRQVPLHFKPITHIAPKGKGYSYTLKTHITPNLQAPIAANQVLGYVELYVNNAPTQRVELVASKAIARASRLTVVWQQLIRLINHQLY